MMRALLGQLAAASVLASVLVLGACASHQPAPVAHDEAVSRGAAFAQDACAACHAVGPGEVVSPNPSAPSFQAVADSPGMTDMALRAWLNSSHSGMPDFIIAPEQIDDLSAYLLALKTRNAAAP